MVIDGISSRFGTALGKGLKAEDSLWAGLYDTYVSTAMGTVYNVYMYQIYALSIYIFAYSLPVFTYRNS